ncbi:YkvI family membrane protein [Texcoconibacillus texcoconensis]|uniref:Putative membrane protein YkvI n=1 Tax=Texcoconibacillus texcoconensis TaxID=1095777 RepID=A0A840QTZ9_9BACI|nr:hypothetical protein [Texcoconibacillus texcoconensis]MBB5174769.1 putative membrane protein YkvI [Texcoconibacillus texcoconensis]
MWQAGFKWMFLIIGTMIGAGYASGRELWQFFGSESTLAIILFAIFFFVCCFVIMSISYEKQSQHYIPILQALVGKRLTRFYDGMIFLYLFSMSVIMIAGGGATLEVMYVPYWYGVILMSALLVVLFIWGIRGMTSMNALIIPLLILFLIGSLLAFQWMNGFPIQFDVMRQSNWPTAFTFTALNILPLIAVLSAVGQKISHPGEIWIASLGSAGILGSVSLLYNESLLQVAHEAMLYEIPLFAIIANYPHFMVLIMSGLLWGAIYTSAASGVFGICTRIQHRFPFPLWLLALIAVCTMIPLTTFGFSQLVAVLYPLYGILNLYMLAAIVLYPILERFEKV